jgi:hypothetical protein
VTCREQSQLFSVCAEKWVLQSFIGETDF